jgi:hypothetical protein
MQPKIQESTLIAVTLLVVVAVFLTAVAIRDYAPVVNDSFSIRKTSVESGVEVTSSIPATVVINEIMADNAATIESSYGTYPDWVELYNTGNQTVDLRGMYLSDSLSNPTWQFAEGTALEPGKFLLVWADGDPDLGALYTDFKLNANGEVVTLFASDGRTLIDSVQYDKQIQDVSYGRSPDGTANWKYMTKASPGSANLDNTRSNNGADWPIWLGIILALTGCVLFVLKDRIQARRRK